jgi:probable HAF family extracellular repeat protein
MKSSVIVVLAALAAVVLTACGGAARPIGPAADVVAPPEYSVVTLGFLGDGSESWAVGVNNSNQVVGVSYTTADGYYGPHHGFLWENGVMQDLGTLGGTRSYPTEINDRGQVVGWADTPDGALHAFFWDKGSMQDLGPVAVSHWNLNRYTAAHVNNRGQVIGNRPGGGPFLWQDGVTQELPLAAANGINNQGQVVGSVLSDSAGVLRTRAALWEDGVVTELGTLGGSGSSGTAISNSGWVAGVSGSGPLPNATYCRYGGTYPFRWKTGGMENLGNAWPTECRYKVISVTDQGQVVAQVPGEDDTHFWDHGVWHSVQWAMRWGGVNNHGVITGSVGFGGSGFVWQDGVRHDLPPGSGTDGLAINDANVVAGSSRVDPSSYHTVATIWVPAQAVVSISASAPR